MHRSLREIPTPARSCIDYPASAIAPVSPGRADIETAYALRRPRRRSAPASQPPGPQPFGAGHALRRAPSPRATVGLYGIDDRNHCEHLSGPLQGRLWRNATRLGGAPSRGPYPTAEVAGHTHTADDVLVAKLLRAQRHGCY